MNVAEFDTGTSGHLTSVADNGKPLPITRRGRDHVTVVPTGLWREAEEALELIRGLRQLGVDINDQPHAEAVT